MGCPRQKMKILVGKLGCFYSTGCRGKLPAMNLERRSKRVEGQGGSGDRGHHLGLFNTRHKAVSALVVFP